MVLGVWVWPDHHHRVTDRIPYLNCSLLPLILLPAIAAGEHILEF